MEQLNNEDRFQWRAFLRERAIDALVILATVIVLWAGLAFYLAWSMRDF